MKIIMKDIRPIKRFEEIAIGEVFAEEIDGRLIVQMRIEETWSKAGFCYRAVNLDNGELYEMHDTDPVKAINTELIVI